MQANLFTPRISEQSQERKYMILSDVDYTKIRRGSWSATVTDVNTGISYKVRGAPCSLPNCYCDAVIGEPVAS